jgi:hypothetical protein
MRMMMALLIALAGTALAATPAPEGAEVYFISPSDGAVISGPVTVRFGLRNMGISPAGHDAPNSGHHHVLIDLDPLPPLDQPLPKNEQVVHFGGGQTETILELPPGEHSLQLLLGDYAHIPHDPPVVSKRITITVQ